MTTKDRPEWRRRTLWLMIVIGLAAVPVPWALTDAGAGAAFAQDDDDGGDDDDDGGDDDDDGDDDAGGATGGGDAGGGGGHDDDGGATGGGDAGGGGGDDDDGGATGGGDAGGGGGDDDGNRDNGNDRAGTGDDDDDDVVTPPRRNRAPAVVPRQGRAQTVQRTPRRAAPAPAPVPPPQFVRSEIVVTNLSDADLAVLLAEGFAVLERVDLVDLAVVMHRLRAPEGLTLEAARDRVRAQPSGAAGDFNHYYRHEEGASATDPGDGSGAGLVPAAAPVAAPAAACTHLNCAALSLIGWPDAGTRAANCPVTVPVGVIDTGVNAAHENLAGARIEVLRLVPDAVDPSRAVHGTAVAALLVGQPADRAPGLIPEAQVIAVDVFGRESGDERATVDALIRALDLLSQRGVRVINMSLAGPPNAVLETALARLADPGGAVVLAAAGNAGPQGGVAYPAGYPTVVAVTAVDRRGRIYRQAQRGRHVDLAAPGVEVWSATSISGVKPRTGTSFAVPFATAVAAILASREPAATPGMLADRLRASVRDMGAPGSDEVFGGGLLALGDLCAAKFSAPAVE